jgi:adenylosuccinate lyase
MASENILMQAVKRGADRQAVHEKIRLHSIEAGKQVKEEGKTNDLIERIAADASFNLSKDELSEILDPKLYTGRAANQTVEFLNSYVYPLLKSQDNFSDIVFDLKV